LTTLEALRLAQEKGLDLIEIVPTALPPVAKITDYGKWKYTEEKKERETKANRQEVEIRGVRFGISISKHDMEVKAEKAKEFLEKGHKLQVDVVLRGRAKGTHEEFAKKKFYEFTQIFPFPINVDEEPKKGPRGIIAVISKGKNK